MSSPIHIHIRMHSAFRSLISLQPKRLSSQHTQLTNNYSTKGASARATVKSSRDPTTGGGVGIRPHRRGGQQDPLSTSDLRKTVMGEVAIPGRFQQYFRLDKRATRKAEGSVLSMDRSRSPKKVSAAKWSNSSNITSDREIDDDESDNSSNIDDNGQENVSGSRSVVSRTRGFDNVGWRALEQTYARDVLPHPYFHRDYLDITEIKVLSDRKTFQLWYRPKPDDRVSADQIAEVVTQHAAAFKAMLARHAARSSSSRLAFQLVRQSDRQADMPDLWKRLEEQVDLHSRHDDDGKNEGEDKASTSGGRRR